MNNLKRLVPFVRPHSKAIAGSIIFMILSGALSAAFFYLFENVLRRILNVTSPDAMLKSLRAAANSGASDSALGAMYRSLLNTRVDQSELMRQVNIFMLVVFVWAILRVSVDFCLTYLTQRTGQRVLTELRARLFAHFQSLSVGFFEKRRTGEIMSRLTNDLGALQSVLTVAVISAIKAPVEVIGALVYMFSKNWQLSLFVFLILPPAAFLINRAGKRVREATTALQRQIAEMTNYLQEKIAAMRLIQTFGTRDYEIERFNKVNQESYKRTMKPIKISASLAPTIEFVGYAGVLVVLWFGASRGMAAEGLLVFLFAMHRCAMQFKAIASLNTMFKSADAAAERLFEMLDTQPEVRDVPNAIDLRTREVKGHLRFEDVRFSYGEGEVLRGISFEIKPGEVVALAGLSGSGKTTISNLVPRLYDPSAGRVTLDGLDLREVSLLSLRAHIGAVPQETTLFHGTIRDNIAYGKPDATDDEIIEAARGANAHNFIAEFPDGYSTAIGERGGRLSGGQRQRIAIARALLRDPRILILDEATSALDAESEKLVQDALTRLMQGRTTLIIAHRFSTIRHANQILVMENGDIAETGTHDELLARGGIYARLYQMQTFAARAEEPKEIDEANEMPLLAAPLAAA
ncbi:MAG TPA: ABC transporter ATP-binding protein [Abditibacteriaceae bacterium]|jgi:subfamily B ATP-binding cassette protein MsbA